MKNTSIILAGLALMVSFSSCKKEEPSLGPAHSEADAAFTYAASADNPNIIEFTATNSQVRAIWDLGNGIIVTETTTATGTYPYAGTYTVTLPYSLPEVAHPALKPSLLRTMIFPCWTIRCTLP